MRYGVLAIVTWACGGGNADDMVPDARAWATYTIRTGQHTADLAGREPKNPLDGVTDTVGRDYELVLDPTAVYELTEPVEPNDQLDWNKLPGLSDCGTLDLSVNGAMFGWRWRLDLAQLEVAAYANNDSVHLATTTLFSLDGEDLAARVPLRYRVWRETAQYRFAVEGLVLGRTIAVDATLPRACSSEPLDELAWAGAFYFGGTSTAPHPITAQVREASFGAASN